MDINQIITDFILQLATQHPIVLTIIAVLGTIRVVMKPLMTFLKLVAAQTATPDDDKVLIEVETSAAYKGFLFLLDWFASIKVAPKVIALPAPENVVEKPAAQ